MKKIKIIFAAMLCLSLAAAFIACDTKEDTKPTAATHTDVPGDVVEEDLSPPAVNMGGKKFTFLTTGWGSGTLSPDIVPLEEELGDDADPILQLAQNRRTAIESKFNVTLAVHNVESASEVVKTYQDAFYAGISDYDIAITTCSNFSNLLSGKFMIDLEEIPTLDMDKPYWNKNFYDAMAILGRHFATDGDVSKRSLECVWIMAFNKSIIANKGLESPFDLVKDGKWTFDKMHEMGKIVGTDMNADGKMTLEDDLWGINYTGDSIMGIVNGSGVKLAELDSEGKPFITAGSEVNIAKLTKIYDKMRDHVYSIDTLFPTGGGVSGIADVQIFMDGRALFVAAATHNITGHDGYNLRSAEIDFGIIPYPKWDINDKNYLPHTAGNFHPVLSIPATNQDLENTGIILEAMAYEGMKTIRPEFYDSLLKRKTLNATDTESGDMIDYIFGNLYYDIGNMFNFGTDNTKIVGIFGATMSRDTKLGIASQIDRNSGPWNRSIASIIAQVKSY